MKTIKCMTCANLKRYQDSFVCEAKKIALENGYAMRCHGENCEFHTPKK